MAATDMKLAGLEAGAKVTVSGIGEPHDPDPTGTVLRVMDPFGADDVRGDAIRVLLDPAEANIHYANGDPHPAAGREIGCWRQDCTRHYTDAQTARRSRAEALCEEFAGDYDLSPTDTLERFCGVEENQDDRGRYWLQLADTFEEVAELLGGNVLDGWEPVKIHDLDTGEAIDVTIADPVVSRSEDAERGGLSDRQALDRVNRILSSPDWSVSFLEDVAAIVRRTGRVAVEGVQHDRH